MPALVQIELPALHPGQQDIWDSPARFKVVCCGRRYGKTHLGVLMCVDAALQGQRAWWVGPSYPVAAIGWNLLKWLVRPIPGIEIKESDRVIHFPGGGTVQVKSADRPDSLRGEGLDLVVLDEVADIKPEAWIEALRPTLAERRGRAMFIGTPRGMDNWFYEIYEKAGNDNTGIWARWQRPTSDNPYVPALEIEAAREDMGPILFAQEFLAEFVVPGGSVFRPEWWRHYLTIGSMQRYEPEASLVLTHEGFTYESVPLRRCVRYATVDLAASLRTGADYTVIGAFGRTPGKRTCLLDIERKRMEAPDILPALKQMMEKWKLSFIGMEQAAYQLAMVQLARREGLPIRAIRPDKDKLARAMLAAARMESGQVWFPRTGTKSWMRDFEAEIMRFPQAEHDDQVDVLAYGVDQSTRMATGPQILSW